MAADQKNKIIIEKLMGGIINRYASLSHADEGAEDEYSLGDQVTTIRPESIGNLAPGFSLTNLTDANTPKWVNGLPLNGVVSSDGYAFILLKSNRIIRINLNSSPFTVEAKLDITLAGTHATHTLATNGNGDINIYKNDAGTEFILFSYEDNTDGDIGVVQSDLSTGLKTDWFSTTSGGGVLSTGVPLKLSVDNMSNVYCTNGRYIAFHNPTLVTSNASFVDRGKNFIGTSICNYGDYEAFVGYRGLNTASSNLVKGNASLCLLNVNSGSLDYSYDLQDTYAGCIINHTDLVIFTQGRNNTGKIKRFTGNGVETLKEIVGMTPPAHGGADIFLNCIIFDSNGTLYSWGSSDELKYKKGLHKIGSSGSGGMVKTLYQNTPYIGNLTTTISYMDSTQYATSVLWYSRLINLPTNSHITGIKVYFSQFGTGANVLFSLFKDNTTASIGGANDMLNYTIDNATYGAITYHYIDKVIEDINAFYLVVSFNHNSVTNTAAIIRKIEVEYMFDPNTI